jgi:hypothetical protein
LIAPLQALFTIFFQELKGVTRGIQRSELSCKRIEKHFEGGRGFDNTSAEVKAYVSAWIEAGETKNDSGHCLQGWGLKENLKRSKTFGKS